MFVLALDSSTRDGSIALLYGDRVLVERRGDAERPYAERLPADLLEVLAAAPIAPADVDLFAVAAGPGSFTGLRIGIAAMQGLAVVTQRPLIAVSVLDAIAHAAAVGLPPGSRVGAWVDAYRHEVFSALYEIRDAAPFTRDRLLVVEPPRVDLPATIAADWRELGPARVMGNGATRYAPILASADLPAADAETWPPIASTLATSVGRLALDRGRRGETQTAGEVQPFYVRRPDVEVAREQRGHA